MAETRRKFDTDFREGAVRLVRETGKPIAQVARDLGINAGTLGNWVNADKRRRGDGSAALDEDERAELAQLRRENAEVVGHSLRPRGRTPAARAPPRLTCPPRVFGQCGHLPDMVSGELLDHHRMHDVLPGVLSGWFHLVEPTHRDQEEPEVSYLAQHPRAGRPGLAAARR
jgi:transposase